MPNLTGTKWAKSGGSTVVTWSITDAGLSGVSSTFETRRSDVSGDPDAFFFNEVRALRESFAAWSKIANIDFVQVEDQGERIGAGFGADIRITFGELDGRFGDTLGLAFFPARGEPAFAGDILFDADETGFFSQISTFKAVATHEIGHAIGLDHISTVTALMNPRISGISRPVADDIQGAQQIYGANSSDIGNIRLSARQPDIDIKTAHDGLQVLGNSLGNDIRGGGGDETLNGRAGSDVLIGRGGHDTLLGAAGGDEIRGGTGRDEILGGAGNDLIFGNVGNDRIRAGGNNDTVFGGFGNDTIIGQAGRDRLSGDSGNDLLTGGVGRDEFVFATMRGRDVITDFELGIDRLDFSANVRVEDMGDLRIVQNGNNTVVLDGSGGRAILRDIDAVQLETGDFIL